MLIEKEVESKIADAIAALGIESSLVTASREPAESGRVKGEIDPTKGVIIAVTIGLRANDAFSLPTADLSGSVAVSTRGEMNATGAAHDETMESVVDLLDGWHFDGQAFSQAVSVDRYFAAEIRLDGGNGKMYNQQTGCWEETFSFTIRGTIRHVN